jgi:hypothetical protein
MAMMEPVLVKRRRGHKEHLRPKLTAKIKVANCLIRFNKQATRWLGVWIEADMTFKKHHNRYIKQARAADPRL